MKTNIINNNTMFFSGIPQLGILSQRRQNATRIPLIKIGGKYIQPYTSIGTGRHDFAKLKELADKNPKVIEARRWQALEDEKTLEKSFLDINI